MADMGLIPIWATIWAPGPIYGMTWAKLGQTGRYQVKLANVGYDMGRSGPIWASSTARTPHA